MSQENVDVVLRLIDAFNRRDAAAGRALWAADGEWQPAYFGGGLLEGTVFRGVDRLAEFIELQSETWESAELEPLETRDDGDWVMVKLRLSARGRASGISLEQVTWNVYRLRAGKVATGRAYTVEREALEDVGLPG